MLLDDDIVKFSLNDELYTLQLTDNVDMKLKVKKGKNTYYIATKEELINNLTSSQEYNEDNEIKIYCYIDDELVQLGVKENIVNLQIDTISFTTDNFTITNNIKTFNLGSYIKESNIKKAVTEIKYNQENESNFIIKDALVTDNSIKPSLDGNLVSVERELLVYEYDTAFDFTSNDVLFNEYGSVKLKPHQSEYDYVSLYYNNTNDFIISDELDIVANDKLSLKSFSSTMEREDYTFEDVTNYTLDGTSQFGTDFIGIEPEPTI